MISRELLLDHLIPMPREELALAIDVVTTGARILVVDDEPSITTLIRMILQEEGFTVGIARDGRFAVELLTEGWGPDLIILDLMMPRMTGREVITYLKDDERFERIPVLAMSAGVNLKLLTFDYAQPDALLPKPFDIDALVAQVRHLLRLKGVD